MNCPQCNAELPAGASFCPQCGNPIPSVPVSSADPFVHLPAQSGTGTVAIGLLLLTGVILIVVSCFPTFFPQMFPEPVLFDPHELAVKEDPNFKTGTPLDLYGKTIDDKDFDWASLRGKYVLVKFTATWCGPCKGEIPGMLDAYEKYHDKGLEIVSVYIWERGQNSVATVEQFVEKEKLPWIIVSESLTEKAGLPPQGKKFNIEGVPTMLLVDKEGKILVSHARGGVLQQELEKLFGK